MKRKVFVFITLLCVCPFSYAQTQNVPIQQQPNQQLNFQQGAQTATQGNLQQIINSNSLQQRSTSPKGQYRSQAQQQMQIMQAPQGRFMNQQGANNIQQNSYVEDVDDIHAAMDVYKEKHSNLRPIQGKRPHDPNLVQLCLLLDTSNSMDGLINQAKSQLWTIVNELSAAQKGKEDIRLEVALYEYGNDGLPMKLGYIRQVTPFTEDLDLLSEKLFDLSTNGGSEYCGYVIGVGLNQLKWNMSEEGLKIIYIAGNEPFHQGPINFKVPCGIAAERNVIVNTIHCGNFKTGVDTNWQAGAVIGKGNYFAIDSDKVTEGIPSPYDDELIRLNSEINQTYIAYGSSGQENQSRQFEQDANASSISKSIFAGRAVSKGGKLYKASSWDLVDGLNDQTISIEKVERKYLPKELRKKTDKELKAYVAEKSKERKMIKEQIAELSKKREAFIQKKLKEKYGDKSLGSAIIKSLQTQAQSQNFTFEK